MEDTILDDDVKKDAELVLSTIRKYEEGDLSLEDDVVDIIGGLWDYTKYSKKVRLQYKFIIMLYKSISLFKNINESIIKEAYASVDSYYELYVSSSEELKRYLNNGFKTGDFPDLEAAYLLTIYLSSIITNINDYLSEINSMEKSIYGGYNYFGNKNITLSCEQREEKVKKLVDSIRIKREENEEV